MESKEKFGLAKLEEEKFDELEFVEKGSDDIWVETSPIITDASFKVNNPSKDNNSLDNILSITSDEDKMREFVTLVKVDGFNKAVKSMNEKVKVEEQVIEVEYKLKCFADEGAVALFQAVKNITGRVDLNPSPDMSGDNPPEIIDVNLPNGESIKIPWGVVSLPSFDEDSYLEIEHNCYENILTVTGTIKMKFEPEVKNIINEAQRLLDNHSIYKGQAITLEFNSDCPKEPIFLSLNNIDEKKILISDEAKEGLLPILARIKYTEKCIKEGLDLKYGAIMEGTYGTGKTLTAFLIGKIATENGWTFIYLKDCKYLAKTLEIAENYAKTQKGCVVFAEDIDQTIRGSRDSHMQRILNTLDGGDTKQKPIISIFTTNHIELIEPTFLRGKRIGGLISLGALTEKTAKQFIEMFVTNENGDCLMTSNEEIENAAKALVGIVPAFASEIVDKSKAFMISRGGDVISAVDIELAANSYRRQMEHAKMKEVSEEQGVIAAINYLLTAGFRGKTDALFDPSGKIKSIL